MPSLSCKSAIPFRLAKCCIIESMKMMHEIKAPVEGVIVAILVADGEPISTGDRLFELS